MSRGASPDKGKKCFDFTLESSLDEVNVRPIKHQRRDSFVGQRCAANKRLWIVVASQPSFKRGERSLRQVWLAVAQVDLHITNSSINVRNVLLQMRSMGAAPPHAQDPLSLYCDTLGMVLDHCAPWI